MRVRSHSRSELGIASQAATLAAATLLCCVAASAAAADERAAVIAAMQAWERAVEAGHYDELADHYTSDAIYYPHEAAPIVGRDAIIARNRNRGAAATVEITQHVDDVQVNGDWAVYSCLAEIGLRGGGEASTRYARVLLLMQKGEDGRWRILRDIDNGTPDRPPPSREAGSRAMGPAVTFSPDGTASIVNLTVPVPASISAEAQEMLRTVAAAGDPTQGLTLPITELRAITAQQQERRTKELLATFPVSVERKTIAGVPVALVTPARKSRHAAGRLLINVHSGAFIRDQGSITEAIQIAHRSGLPVLAIDYRLAPEHPYPAAVEDTIAVYRELLKTYEPRHLALFGSSAGAILSAQASVRARQLGLPLPAALGFFSGTADFSRPGDSEAFFSMGGLAPLVAPVAVQAGAYLGDNSLTDPVMSPIFADLEGFPPTLLMAGTRDFFLSATANFHRALLHAGVSAELVVFDAMPHEHWTHPGLPETEEALNLQARFLAGQVGAGLAATASADHP